MKKATDRVFALGLGLLLGLAAGVLLAGGFSPSAEESEDGVRRGADARPLDGAEEPRRAEPAPHGDAAVPSPRLAAPSSSEGSEKEKRRRESVLRGRIASLEREADELRRELEASTGTVSELRASAAPNDPRRFELGPADWRELGREGTLKLRLPCASPRASPEQLDQLGLSEADLTVLAGAFKRSSERVWGALEPACAEMFGAEQASVLGPQGCRHGILEASAAGGVALRDFRRAAAALAGDEEPTPRAERGPVETMVLALAQEQRKVEDELAEVFGPDEANRIVFSPGLCFSTATHFLGRSTAGVPSDEPAPGR